MVDEFLAVAPGRGVWIVVGVLGVGLLGGCATTQPVVLREGPVVKPGLVLVTPDQARKHGLELEPSKPAAKPAELPDSAAVLVPGTVRVYSVSRYQDPADADLLHEAHLVYRRESGARWNLETGPAGLVQAGPRSTAVDPNRAPLTGQELEVLLRELQKHQKENQAAIDQVYKLLEQVVVGKASGGGAK